MPRGRPRSDQSEATTTKSGNASSSRKKEVRAASNQPLKSTTEILIENNTSPTLLNPLVEEGSSQVIIHSQVLLLEFNSLALLEEVLRGTTLARFVVRRVGEAAVMVDHLRQDELLKVLTKKGY